MLRELRVKNFAIVEDGVLSLGAGMTAFTGETGAGKSLLLDAITLLLGSKARSDLVRSGALTAEVEGVFDLSEDLEKRAEAMELGFAVEQDEGYQLFVRREISGAEASRNRVWIQGRSATRSQLQQLLGDWVEVSGQHEFLKLGRDSYILGLVDQFGGLREETRSLVLEYTQLELLRDELKSLEQAEANRSTRLDYLKFQLEEFDRAGIAPESAEEEARLESLRARLGSLEKIRVACEHGTHLLLGTDISGNSQGAGGALPALQTLGRDFRPLQELGEDMGSALRMAEEAELLVTEILKRLEKIMGSLDAHPEELEGAEQQLTLMSRLKRKYNVDMRGLVNLKVASQDELSRLEGSTDRLDQLRSQLMVKQEAWKLSAEKLHGRRVKASSELQKSWQRDIRLLGMGRAQLEVRCSRSETLSPSGFTKLEAVFSANAGEAPKNLAKVASGGELSRILLALKNIVAGRSEIGVYLFDEVDAGIGGETAQIVGARLRVLAEHNQVLVVTHLAQIAASAHQQYKIEKVTEKGRTRTLVAPLLSASDREDELARMLGSTGSRAAKQLARELLN